MENPSPSDFPKSCHGHLRWPTRGAHGAIRGPAGMLSVVSGKGNEMLSYLQTALRRKVGTKPNLTPGAYIYIYPPYPWE